jgi:hypothetical protein
MVGSGAAEVLKRVLGTDHIAFEVCSYTVAPDSTPCGPAQTTRSYRSFTEAANENGLSRIYVGWHFRFSVNTGLEHGRKIGARAVRRFLRPT